MLFFIQNKSLEWFFGLEKPLLSLLLFFYKYLFYFMLIPNINIVIPHKLNS